MISRFGRDRGAVLESDRNGPNAVVRSGPRLQPRQAAEPDDAPWIAPNRSTLVLDGLEDLLDALARRGCRLVGPTVRD